MGSIDRKYFVYVDLLHDRLIYTIQMIYSSLCKRYITIFFKRCFRPCFFLWEKLVSHSSLWKVNFGRFHIEALYLVREARLSQTCYVVLRMLLYPTVLISHNLPSCWISVRLVQGFPVVSEPFKGSV